jgi:hypothetical protein
MKVGWEREDKVKPWLILSYHFTVRLQGQETTMKGSVVRSCGLTAARTSLTV